MVVFCMMTDNKKIGWTIDDSDVNSNELLLYFLVTPSRCLYPPPFPPFFLLPLETSDSRHPVPAVQSPDVRHAARRHDRGQVPRTAERLRAALPRQDRECRTSERRQVREEKENGRS